MTHLRSAAFPIAIRLRALARVLSSRRAVDVYALSLVGAAIGLVIFWVIWGIMAWERGSYADEHYGDARNEAINVMAHKYGGVLASRMRLGKPDVVNTHTPNNILTGNAQVRIFHLIGPKGVHYCVHLWGSGSIGSEANQVVKGCKF